MVDSAPSWAILPLKIAPKGYPETSVYHYHSPLSNIPEEHRSHLHRGGSLQSSIIYEL
jgi:hypothetical protein